MYAWEIVYSPLMPTLQRAGVLWLTFQTRDSGGRCISAKQAAMASVAGFASPAGWDAKIGADSRRLLRFEPCRVPWQMYALRTSSRLCACAGFCAHSVRRTALHRCSSTSASAGHSEGACQSAGYHVSASQLAAAVSAGQCCSAARIPLHHNSSHKARQCGCALECHVHCLGRRRWQQSPPHTSVKETLQEGHRDT